jgi:twitching motility protein PilT
VSQRLVLKKEGKTRVAAFEIMIATPAVRNIIRSGKSHQIQNVLETQVGIGMTTMDRSMIAMYRQGTVSHEVAARYVTNPTVLGPAPE